VYAGHVARPDGYHSPVLELLQEFKGRGQIRCGGCHGVFAQWLFLGY
jgi:hypothetical protein